jgi:hypothetical protein
MIFSVSESVRDKRSFQLNKSKNLHNSFICLFRYNLILITDFRLSLRYLNVLHPVVFYIVSRGTDTTL